MDSQHHSTIFEKHEAHNQWELFYRLGSYARPTNKIAPGLGITLAIDIDFQSMRVERHKQLYFGKLTCPASRATISGTLQYGAMVPIAHTRLLSQLEGGGLNLPRSLPQLRIVNT
jgi:hypothetical protein